VKGKEINAVIKIVCAWCGLDMGEKDGEGQAGISHGMCPECLAIMKLQIKAEQERTLSFQLAHPGGRYV